MKKIGLLFIFLLSISISAQNANHVVIAEVYGGGGNSGATIINDYILLYNPTGSSVDVSSWSVQYTSSTGSSWSSNTTNLTGSIGATSYYLIQEAAGSGGTTSLPTPDVTGSINMSATNGKVALVNSTTALTGTDPSGDPSVVDFIGYGSANGFEGVAASALTNTTSNCRKGWDGSNAQSTYGESYGNGFDTKII
jgi:predicted extracellular nuclease